MAARLRASFRISQLAEALYTDPAKYADAWNFGPNDDDVKSVETIVNI